MNVKEAIRSRRSIRRYREERIPKDKLSTILEMARLAPSASNRQPWEFIIVQDKDTRKKIAEGCKYGSFLSQCSVIIVGCGDMDTSSKWYALDTFISMEHIALTAVEEGLGTCWIGAFDEAAIVKLLRIPKNLKIIALMALGVPDENPKPRSRKALSEFVSYERWGNKTPTKREN
jgi:nitroreductase